MATFERSAVAGGVRYTLFILSINSFLENGGKKSGPRTKILYQTCNKVDSWNTLKTRLVSARMKEKVSLSIYLKIFYSYNNILKLVSLDSAPVWLSSPLLTKTSES